MKQTLNKYIVFIIPAIFFYGVVLTLLFTKTNYSVVAPGYNDNVDYSIYVEPVDAAIQEGSFHTTSVFSMEEISLYQQYLGMLLDTVTIEQMGSFYDSIDLNELQIMGVLMKDDSIQTSLIVGIEAAGHEISYTSYPTVYLTYTHLTPHTLQIGDSILSVNGNNDVYAALDEVACGEAADVVVMRDGETITVSPRKIDTGDYCSFGLYVLPYTEIEQTDVEYHIYNTNTGGPSGGLMQSLFVYNQLTDFDYSLGLKIGGTGTIDVDGNVGYIGGIREKIITAIGNNIDVFFVPYLEDSEEDNYIAALRVLEEFNTDMVVVGVATFDEAVTYLEGYGDINE